MLGAIYLVILIVIWVSCMYYAFIRPKKMSRSVPENNLVSLSERVGSPVTNTVVRTMTVTPLPDGNKRIDLSQTETIEAKKTFYIS